MHGRSAAQDLSTQDAVRHDIIYSAIHVRSVCVLRSRTVESERAEARTTDQGLVTPEESRTHSVRESELDRPQLYVARSAHAPLIPPLPLRCAQRQGRDGGGLLLELPRHLLQTALRALDQLQDVLLGMRGGEECGFHLGGREVYAFGQHDVEEAGIGVAVRLVR